MSYQRQTGIALAACILEGLAKLWLDGVDADYARVRLDFRTFAVGC